MHAQDNENAKQRQVARERHEDYRDDGFIHATISGVFTCALRGVLKEMEAD